MNKKPILNATLSEFFDIENPSQFVILREIVELLKSTSNPFPFERFETFITVFFKLFVFVFDYDVKILL